MWCVSWKYDCLTDKASTCFLSSKIEEVCHTSVHFISEEGMKKNLFIPSLHIHDFYCLTLIRCRKMLVQIWTYAQDSIPNQVLAVWMCLRMTDMLSKYCFSCCHVYEYQMWLFIKDHSDWDYCVCLVSQSLGSLSIKMIMCMLLYFIGFKYL